MNSFINDVTQQFFEYVGDTNREKGHNRTVAYNYLFPIIDPQGSRDPFYYNIDKHVGGSDHTSFLAHGVPAVLFNYWPDQAYHTSEDRPWSADPTQLKREAFISLASGHVMASADGPGAVRIAEMTAGQAMQRNATELRRALQIIGDHGPLREARVLVEQAYVREAEEIRSAKILAESDAKSVARIEELATAFVETHRSADLALLNSYAKSTLGSSDVKLTSEEEQASKLVPRLKPGVAMPAARGGGGGGGGGGANSLIPGAGAQEAVLFIDGKRTILDIRDGVSAEFFPLDTGKFIEFYKNMEKAGQIELVKR
jgi:aminopeptidase YwaD